MRCALFTMMMFCALSATAGADEASALKILSDHCVKCHGDKKQSSQLRLTDPQSIAAGGSSGIVVIAGKSTESRLVQVVSVGGEPHMPPGKKQLNDEQIKILKDWIDAMPPVEPDPTIPSQPKSPPSENRWLPDGLDPAIVIDLLLEAGYRERGITAVGVCDDLTFVRRLYIDLIGRIPTISETDAFLRDTNSLKRSLLVDRLLDTQDHHVRMADALDTMLLGRNENKLGQRRNAGWHAYLEATFRENRSWSQVAREILLARATSKDRGYVWYLYEQNDKHQDIAERVARGFFGIDIACAQCHDHPLAPEILQAHYWGLVGFYKRGKNTKVGNGFAVSESAIGAFDEYANALSGTTDTALLTFVNRGTVPENRPADPSKQKDSEDLYRPVKGEPKVPLFSRRQKFVDEILAEHPLLARAFVNRIWALLMGRGIVHPADKMDSAHPPSHPDLLDWLARDFALNEYRPRRLIRAIVMSRAYQLDSRRPDQNLTPSAFAYGLIKPMEAEALIRSLPVALDVSAESVQKIAPVMRSLFPEVLPENDLSTLKQSMALSNHPKWNLLMKEAAKNKSLRLDEPSQTVDLVWKRAYGRAAEKDEKDRIIEFLSQRMDRPSDAVAQLLWAVVTSAEFRFSH